MKQRNSTGGVGQRDKHPSPSELLDLDDEYWNSKLHMPDLKCAKIGQWIVVWGGQQLSTKTFWEELAEKLGDKAKKIMRLKKVTQKDGWDRFDMIAEEDEASNFVKLLQNKFPHLRIRRHKPYSTRHIDTNTQGEHLEDKRAKKTAAWCRMVSMNVNGINKKRESLAVWAQRDEVDVLCLQEHMRGPADWRVRLPGFHCFSSPAGSGEGQRGVAVLVRKGIPCFERVCAPNYVLVEILVGGNRILVGSAYLTSGKRREQTRILKDLAKVVKAEMQRVQYVAVLGDFNNDRDMITKRLETQQVGLKLLDVDGNAATFHRSTTGRQTAIDHVLVSPQLRPHAAKAKVLTEWDFSDHYPISADFDFPTALTTAASGMQLTRRKFDCSKIPGAGKKIRQSNRYLPLLTLMQGDVTDEAMDDVANKFVEASQALAEEIIGVPPARRHKGFISRNTKKLVLERSAMHGEVRAATATYNADPSEESKDELGVVRSRYRLVARRVEANVKAERTKHFQQYVGEAVALVTRRNFRKLFQWCKGFINGEKARGSKNQITTPVRNTQGELVLEPDGILEVWATHFEGLAKDVTGHSKQRLFWEQRMPQSKDLSELPNLNAPVSWSEVQECMESMAKGKAPGSSGIPVEWLLFGAEPTDSATPAVPTSHLGKVVLFLVSNMLERGYIPAAFRSSILVPVPKKGDLTLVDNYRGISLIDSVSKVACTLLNRRLCKEIEAAGRLCKEQAGFRQSEEGIGQVISLIEVCERRRDVGSPTFIGFIDYSKAYDTVPHEAALRKLERAGVKGSSLKFVRSLLDTSSFRVRMPCGLSRSVTLERGLPQGCPISCVIFDIFINDSLDALKGCKVPSATEAVKGLMFADDQAILCESVASCKKDLKAVGKWADDNEMKVNIGKCGVMAYHFDMSQLRKHKFTIGREQVPVVDEYVYLGVLLNNELSLKAAVAARRKKVLGAVADFQAFFKSASIPLHLRLRVLKTFILPVATFAGELLGFDERLAKPIQAVIDQALRSIFLGNGRSHACSAAKLHREAGVAPLFALMSGLRLRAWLKFPSLRTWAKILGSSPVNKKVGSKAWFAKSAWYLKRYGREVISLPPSQQTGALIEHLWNRGEARVSLANSEPWHRYQSMLPSRDYLQVASFNHAVIRGTNIMTKMRLEAYWTAPRLTTAGKLGSQYATKCPCCRKPVPETNVHILLRCKTWKKQRDKMIQSLKDNFNTSGYNWEDYMTGGSTEDRTTLLLGGEAAGRTLWPMWSQGTVTSPDSEAIAPTKPWFVPVAVFLDAINGERCKYLAMISNTSTKSQSPQDTAALPAPGPEP